MLSKEEARALLLLDETTLAMLGSMQRPRSTTMRRVWASGITDAMVSANVRCAQRTKWHEKRYSKTGTGTHLPAC